MKSTRNTQAMRLAVNKFLEQIRLDWRISIPAMLLPGVGSTFAFYIPPLLIARILVLYAQNQTVAIGQLIPIVLLFALAWSLGEILWRIGIHLMIKTETKGIERLYVDAINYLMSKDLAFFHNNFSGSVTKKAIAYSKKYEDFMDTVVFSVVANLLPLPFIIFILWRFSPWLVVTLIGMMSLSLVIIIPLIRRRQRLVDIREAASNVVAGHVADTISNMDAVKAFAREDHESATHVHQVRDYIKKAKKSWDYQNLRVDVATSPLYVGINVLGLVVVLLLHQKGVATLEAVFVTFSYYAGFTRVMWDFNRVYRNIESAITESAQFTELMLDDPKLKDPLFPKKFVLKSGGVEFRDITFKYSNKSGEHLFKNLNLNIVPGEKIALVGRSGGGKTTITKLLLRFMDIDNGQILIDGQNIADIKQVDLRNQIAYVPQDPIMFHRSLRDNISYGNLTASEADIKKVAGFAHAKEFIEKLPEKYETLVGERGVKLSGGQRQRIAIARAMIKDAPILLLDEATSALDSESEKLIQDALWKLMEGRTAIVIAHRLSTIQKMDRIIVLEEGKIIEEGTHQQLIAHNGTYAGLWKHQSGGFLEE